MHLFDSDPGSEKGHLEIWPSTTQWRPIKNMEETLGLAGVAAERSLSMPNGTLE